MMKKVTHCRCCGSSSIKRYLNLGKQPLANSYHKEGEKLVYFPLEVMVCTQCFHSQLSIVVDPHSMFTNYLYVSGTTETFRNHCKELAKNALIRFKKKKVTVLDIACNDGTQLEYFREFGASVYGVDPAKNLREMTRRKHIPVVVDFWRPAVAQKINKKFDLITGTNVFAHVNDLDEFLAGVTIALKDDGILLLEFPYANMMIEHNEFDTVYHEHLSYFLVNSFVTLMERNNFHIIDILQTKIHGGSIRFFVQKGKQAHCRTIKQLLVREKEKGLLSLSTYLAFAQRVKRNKNQMKKILKNARSNNMKIVGYAASAKGNTMLNYFKIHLDYIVDDNSLKHGLLTPGRDIPIKAPSVLQDEKRSIAVVVLAWNFYNEIIEKVKHIRTKAHNDLFITYVPHVQVFTSRQKKELRVSA